jgi:NADH:ubiquinone oxidoreductase subunit 4 (subunit M)
MGRLGALWDRLDERLQFLVVLPLVASVGFAISVGLDTDRFVNGLSLLVLVLTAVLLVTRLGRRID